MEEGGGRLDTEEPLAAAAALFSSFRPPEKAIKTT
jgi:hypothetical protein